MRCWPRTRPERWRLAPPLTSRGAPRSVRGRPSGLQAAAHRCATALRAGLDPGDHCGPWAAATRARPKGLPPAAHDTPQPRQTALYRDHEKGHLSAMLQRPVELAIPFSPV